MLRVTEKISKIIFKQNIQNILIKVPGLIPLAEQGNSDNARFHIS